MTRLVLILDDERGLQEAIARAVRRHLPPDAVLRTAATPDEALTILEHESAPHDAPFVLSDFNLGEPRTGLDFLEDAGRARPRALRVLMSGYSVAEFQDRARRLGLAHVVPKPMPGSALRELVEEWLKGEP